jgi:hypothetical protein
MGRRDVTGRVTDRIPLWARFKAAVQWVPVPIAEEEAMTVSRPPKLTHAQTILYESDMLSYAAGKLDEANWQTEKDGWIYLEAFLVHFRNLIEFFGHPDPRGDDLTIVRPESFWPDASTRPAGAALAKLRRRDLWDKYEVGQPDRISKYLHHCTQARVGPKDWEVGTMYGQLKPTLDEFEVLLPDKGRTWNVAEVKPISAALSGPVVLRKPAS